MMSSTILFAVGVCLVATGFTMAAFPSLYRRACAVWDLLRDFNAATADDTGHDYSDDPRFETPPTRAVTIAAADMTVRCYHCGGTIREGHPYVVTSAECDGCAGTTRAHLDAFKAEREATQ
jgi:hypothetical protein